MKNKSISFMTQAAMIAAIYVVLTVVFAPISFGEVQVRIAEALTVLPLFTPAAIPGLFLGCLTGNLLGGAILPDILFGSLATLLGAVLTHAVGKSSLSNYLGVVPPILSNTVIIPFVLHYGYGLGAGVPYAILLFMVSVGIGEVLSCGLLGTILYVTLNKYKNRLFRQTP